MSQRAGIQIWIFEGLNDSNFKIPEIELETLEKCEKKERNGQATNEKKIKLQILEYARCYVFILLVQLKWW